MHDIDSKLTIVVNARPTRSQGEVSITDYPIKSPAIGKFNVDGETRSISYTVEYVNATSLVLLKLIASVCLGLMFEEILTLNLTKCCQSKHVLQ